MNQDVDLSDGTPIILSIKGEMFAVISLDALRALQDKAQSPTPMNPDDPLVEKVVRELYGYGVTPSLARKAARAIIPIVRDAERDDVVARICAPGDMQDSPRWILRFADNDLSDMHFDNADEAHARWQFHCGPSGSWNGWLFETAKMRAPIPHEEKMRWVEDRVAANAHREKRT